MELIQPRALKYGNRTFFELFGAEGLRTSSTQKASVEGWAMDNLELGPPQTANRCYRAYPEGPVRVPLST